MIFGRFWGILSKLDFQEKGQLLARLCPEGAQRNLFTTKSTKDTEKIKDEG
jgi:hypothetical protein